MLKHRVDLTFHGHHHSYQRTCPVYDNTCMGYGDDGVPLAPVHMVIGNAGAGLSINVHTKQPEVRSRMPTMRCSSPSRPPCVQGPRAGVACARLRRTLCAWVL